ncbi:MAG TPA: polyamine ABC transporter substrate-binding protein [Thermomicrobiales bacterium]|nr:polyamine ABC transporter substrate-binding protein [Thermomicrobiales bacterium]
MDDASWRRRTRERLLTRRQFLRAAGIVVGGVTLASCGSNGEDSTPSVPTPAPSPTPERLVEAVEGYDDAGLWVGRSLTITSWGGEYQDAQERAIFEPFQRLTGAIVETDTTDAASLRRQVLEDDVDWDVCDVLLEDVLPMANLGVIELLDYSTIRSQDIYPDVRMEHGVGSSYYSTILAYRPDRWPDQPPPSGWKDFWDVERYPGTRGLHRDAQTTLEFALLSDGVAPADLYPLDLDRAFGRLTEVQTNLVLWWEQGAQPTQMISTGDLDLVGAWNSRIERIRQEGAPVEIQWNGGALSGDAWVIPRNAPNLDIALDFINFATRPEVSAAFSSLVPFGPVNRLAFEHLPEQIAERLPSFPANKDVQFTIDFSWWFNHRDAVDERFDQWFADHP